MPIHHNFFGKNCIIDRDLFDRRNLKRNLADQGLEPSHVLFVNQVHGKEVVVIDDATKIHGERNLPKADALVTNLSNVVIGVITADCGPILFFDEEKRIVGAAHTGWRGAKAGVVKSTVAAMRNLGAEKIHAIIGPMIHQPSYEISQEFFDDFLAENSVNKKFFIAGNVGKYWFDLPSYVEEKLAAEKIASVKNLKIDTYSNEKNFFSFRRSTHLGEKDCGRNLSVIMFDRDV